MITEGLGLAHEEYLGQLEKGELRKAQKDDKNKPKPNPFTDPDRLRTFFLYFLREVVKEKTKLKFHLPETSRAWIEYKQNQYQDNPALWLKEREEILEYCLTANEEPADDFFEEEEMTGEQGSRSFIPGSRSREQLSKESQKASKQSRDT